MTYRLRVLGWLLLGMGTLLAGTTALALLGAFPLTISVFGRQLSPSGHVTFLMFWTTAAALGATILAMTALLQRRRQV